MKEKNALRVEIGEEIRFDGIHTYVQASVEQRRSRRLLRKALHEDIQLIVKCRIGFSFMKSKLRSGVGAPNKAEERIQSVRSYELRGARQKRARGQCRSLEGRFRGSKLGALMIEDERGEQ